jgi:DNA-binding response OmpR family regulator
MTATGREVHTLRSQSARSQRADGSQARSPDDFTGERPVHVLLADDDDRARARYAKALRGSGIEITEARSGDEAVTLSARAAPEVVVLGWPMASGGLPLAERLIGKHGLTGRVIMLAATYDRRDHHAALKAGAQYVVKGPAPEMLVTAIRAAAGRNVAR